MKLKKDIHIFSSLLGSVLAMNISVTDALLLVKNETNNNSIKKVCDKILKNISTGMNLSNALELSGFSKRYCSFIRIGELSGDLPEVLLKYSELEELKSENKNQLFGALFYPCIIIVLAVSVFTILNIIFFKAVPEKYLNFINNSTGYILYSAYNFISNLIIQTQINLFQLIIATIFIFISAKIFQFNILYDYILLKIPIVNRIIINYNLSIFCFTAGRLIKKNVPLTESMDMAAEALENYFIRKQIRILSKNILSVHNPSNINGSIIVDDFILQVIFIGLKKENIVEVMSELSDIYIKKSKTIATRFFYLLPFAIIIFLGIIILLISGSMFFTYWNTALLVK